MLGIAKGFRPSGNEQLERDAVDSSSLKHWSTVYAMQQ